MRKNVPAPGRAAAAVLCLALAGLMCSGAARATECAPSDEAAVVETLNRLYAAASAHDEAALRAVLAADFYAMEDGTRLDTEDLVGHAPAGHASDGASPPITASEVHVLCDSAWATFHTHYTFRPGEGSAAAERAESAVLNYHEGSWQVRFLHSILPAPPPAKTAARKSRRRKHASPTQHADS